MDWTAAPHQTPAFTANLNALRLADPHLAERLCLPVDSSHLESRTDGPPRYKIHRYYYPFVVSEAALPGSLEAADGSRPVLLFGAGIGEQLDALLDKHPKIAVTVWDRDPWLLRLLLARSDHRARITSGQLRLRLGIDLLDLIEEGFDPLRIEHPFLGEVYRFERSLLTRGAGDRRALLRAGTLFVDDLARALGQEGYGVYTLDTERLAREELEHTVRRFRPELLASINYSEGTAEFCHDVGCDLLCWEIDPSTTRMSAIMRGSDRAHIFTYRKANVDVFTRAGFTHVSYLPLASDASHRRPVDLSAQERSEYGAQVTYVGESMVSEALGFRERFVERYTHWATRRGVDPSAGGPLLDRVLAAQRQDLSRYRIVELLTEYGGPFLAEERTSEDPEDPAMLIAEIAASEKRLTYVANLAPFGVVVWGDAGWKQVTRFGARYSGRYARHTDELTKVYNATTINVDIGRLYQSDIVTMRVFDVLACGGFLLAEHSDALEDLFELGGELDSYRDLDELRSKIDYYLRHPETARSIAAAGLDAVRSRHTIRSRVRSMLSALGH